MLLFFVVQLHYKLSVTVKSSAPKGVGFTFFCLHARTPPPLDRASAANFGHDERRYIHNQLRCLKLRSEMEKPAVDRRAPSER